MADHFFSLQIKNKIQSTQDCCILEFEVPDEIQSKFVYKQGQYLTLKAKINGEEVRRSYSLCSSPLDNEWKVGIKKIIDGRFSTYANDVLNIGDTVEVMPPSGKFYVDVTTDQQKNYIAFAAGSGITPIFSIIKTHLQAESKASFKLFYINQTVASIILKEELEALKNIFMDRLEIFYFLTKEHRNVPLLNGRLNEEKLNVIFKSICSTDQIDDYFSCGPQEMIFMVRDFLLSQGIDKNKIHFELFNTTGAAPAIKKEIEKKFKGKTSNITIIEGGKSLNFKMEQGSNNLLDAAMNNAADLPYACKGGVCCTCRAKLVEGDVEVLVNYGLEDEEIEAGYILTCQAVPTSDKVVVDFDS